MNRYLTCVSLVAITICVGCERTPQIRLESRTHGYDFVDEQGTILATADSLEGIGPVLNDPSVKSKLKNSELSIQFYHLSRHYKGFEVPEGITCKEIIDTFQAELIELGISDFETNYDNW